MKVRLPSDLLDAIEIAFLTKNSGGSLTYGNCLEIMSLTTPLRFEPLFRQYLWGGRRLGELLNKPIADEGIFAESWEIVDHGDDQSMVAFGPQKGKTLGELVRESGEELLGRHYPADRFPLLFKFLDAHRVLSVQVHPNDEQGAQLDPPDLGKTEAWIVLHAEPGAKIYSGLKRGFDRHAFEREIQRGTTELCLHSFEPKVGDCVFIPAGTVHALGAGLVIAEIQQASDTTFRIFDWNRVDADGQPRPLHIEQSLAVTDYERGPVSPQQPQPIADQPGSELLVSCDKFVLQRHRVESAKTLGGDNRFHIVAVLDGEVTAANDPANRSLQKGESMLLPAAADPLELTGNATLLDAFLP